MQTLTLPKSGQAMEEGTIVEWAVEEGEQVAEGDPVVVFETDKITDEVTADRDGVLLAKEVSAGETVEVGTVLGYVGDPDEDAPAGGTAGTGAETEAGGDEAPTEIRASPSARRAARDAGVEVEAVGRELGVAQVRAEHVEEYEAVDGEGGVGDIAPAPTGDIRGSPYARNVAGDHGVTIEAVGEALDTDRVRAADVEQYVERAEPATEAVEAVEPVETETAAAGAQQAASGPAVGETVPIEGARGVMYDRMSTVASEYGSTTTIARVDVTDLLDLHEQLGDAWEDDHGVSPSLTAFVVAAAARSLPDYPILNAEIVEGEEVHCFADVNVGIAVNTDGGLLVPTLRDADEATVRGLSEDVARLAGDARAGDLDHDDLQNGTFTVSNAGNLGAYINTPQIKPPQTAILGMCTVFEDAGVVDGEVVPRSYMHLCLTYDHRVVEGATAVEFLQSVKGRLERPAGLLS